MFKTPEDRLSEVQLYEMVAEEIANNQQSKGLWAKAFSEVGGDHEKAKALYIKLRVQMLQDEQKINKPMREAKLRDEAQNYREAKRREVLEERKRKLEEEYREERRRTDKVGQEVNSKKQRQRSQSLSPAVVVIAVVVFGCVFAAVLVFSR